MVYFIGLVENGEVEGVEDGEEVEGRVDEEDEVEVGLVLDVLVGGSAEVVEQGSEEPAVLGVELVIGFLRR